MSTGPEVSTSPTKPPEGAGWFTPQLFVAAGGVKVVGVTLADAGLVPDFDQIQRNGAVHLDELAGKRAR